MTSVQSSFLILVRTGHSSWARRAGRKAVAVTNGGAAAAAATARPARAVMRRSITKLLGARAVCASRVVWRTRVIENVEC